MVTVTVTKHDQSQTHKDRVYFDQKHDYRDAFYVKKGLYMPAIGQMIDADTSSSDFNGKTVWFLNQWRPAAVGAAQRAAAPNRPQDNGNGRLPVLDAPAQALKGWDIQSGDLSRLVSNIVACAIEAKLITSQPELYSWMQSAYEAANMLRTGFPDKAGGPDPSTHAGDPREEGDPGFDDKDFPF